MKNLLSISKKLKIIISVVFLLVLGINGLADKFEKYVEFSPKLYKIEDRKITSEGTVLETTVPTDCRHISFVVKRNNEKYFVDILNFNKNIKLTEFWYLLMDKYATETEKIFSSVPFLYGKFNSLYKDNVLYTWYTGIDNFLYVIYGPDKNIIEDLKYKLNKFR